MTLLKSKILLRNAAFLALAFVVLPAYGGPPLVEVFGCEDYQLTYSGGTPRQVVLDLVFVREREVAICSSTFSCTRTWTALIRLCLMRLG